MSTKPSEIVWGKMEGRRRYSISWVGLDKGKRRKEMMLSPVENFRNLL